jgi:hypothetical protein
MENMLRNKGYDEIIIDDPLGDKIALYTFMEKMLQAKGCDKIIVDMPTGENIHFWETKGFNIQEPVGGETIKINKVI